MRPYSTAARRAEESLGIVERAMSALEFGALGPRLVDLALHLLLADAERPVRREALGVRDRHVGKGLPDHRDAMAADLLDDARLEHAPRGGIERLGVVEGGAAAVAAIDGCVHLQGWKH